MRSTVSWSTQYTVALKNIRRSYGSWSIDAIVCQLLDTINSCSEKPTSIVSIVSIDGDDSQFIDTIKSYFQEYLSIVSIVINRYDRQSVDRHNQLMLPRTSVERPDRYQLIRSTVSWSTKSTLALKDPVDHTIVINRHSRTSFDLHNQLSIKTQTLKGSTQNRTIELILWINL